MSARLGAVVLREAGPNGWAAEVRGGGRERERGRLSCSPAGRAASRPAVGGAGLTAVGRDGQRECGPGQGLPGLGEGSRTDGPARLAGEGRGGREGSWKAAFGSPRIWSWRVTESAWAR